MKITTEVLALMATGAFACAGDVPLEADVGSVESAVTAEQCSAYAVNGQVTVCHVKPSGGVQSVTLTVSKCIQQHVSHPGDTIAVGGVCEPITCTGACGDTSGPGGANKPCCCGDTVTTATTLNGGDPVTGYACAGDGLTLGAGVALDLGGQTVAGSGGGTGVRIPSGGSLRGGTVRGFGVGVLVTSSATLDSAVIEGHAGDGVLVNATGTAARVTLRGLTVRNNADDGIQVLAAPGASNLDGLAGLAAGSFGVETDVAAASLIQGNGGWGIHLGDATQPGDISALLQAGEVLGNVRGGVLLEQRAGLAPGADCGASAGYPGCSGATVADLYVHDNGGTGVELRSGFIIPFSSGPGFLRNRIAHNAMSTSGCTATQIYPQVFIRGPVGLGNATCGAATTQAGCDALSAQHCVWSVDGTCRVAWDLRGSASTSGCGDANKIYGYNNAGPGALDVGARTESPNLNLPTVADLRNTSWVGSPKVSAAGGSTIASDPSCGGLGCMP